MKKQLYWTRLLGLAPAVFMVVTIGCQKEAPQPASVPAKKSDSVQKNQPQPARPASSNVPPAPSTVPAVPSAAPSTVPPAPSDEAPAPSTVEEQIRRIKQEFTYVNKNLNRFDTDTNVLHEGGDVPVTLYREKGSLRKIEINALGSFDMYSYYVEGYFKNDKLIFVMYKNSSAINPVMSTGQVDGWTNEQHRVYVNDGKIIRYLKKEERQMDDDKSQIQTLPNVEIRDSKALDTISSLIEEWFGAASMVSLFGNRGYPCCLTLVGKNK